MPGVLKLSVFEAKGLVAKDKNGFSDPFVDCTIGSTRKKTKIIEKNLNPVWNEELLFDVKEIPKKILVTVWDHDVGEEPDFLGQVTLELSVPELLKGHVIDEWFQLEKRSRRSHVSGSIRLGVGMDLESLKGSGLTSSTQTLASSSSERSTSPSPLRRSGKQNEAAKAKVGINISGNITDAVSGALMVSGGQAPLVSTEPYRRKGSTKKENPQSAGAGDIVFTLVSAQGLLSKEESGLCCAFAKLKLGSQKRESAVIPKTLNPTWNECFIFKGGDVSSTSLEVKLWNDDGKGNATNFLGQCLIELSSIKPGDSWEKTYPLQGRSQRSHVSGQLLVKAERIPYTTSPRKQRPTPAVEESADAADCPPSPMISSSHLAPGARSPSPMIARKTETPAGGEFSRAREIKDGKTNMYYKIIMVGDSGVGKTNIFSRYDRSVFSPSSVATVGVDFFSKVYQMDDKSLVKIQLWDTAGQERYQTVTKQYYRNSLGAVIVYDIRKEKSFQHVTHWLKELQVSSYNDNISILLLGNKCDLPTRTVSFEEGKNLAAEHGMLFFETSALTGENIDEAFQHLLLEIHQKELQKPPEERGSKSTLKSTKKKDALTSSTNNANAPATASAPAAEPSSAQKPAQSSYTVEVAAPPPQPEESGCQC